MMKLVSFTDLVSTRTSVRLSTKHWRSMKSSDVRRWRHVVFASRKLFSEPWWVITEPYSIMELRDIPQSLSHYTHYVARSCKRTNHNQFNTLRSRYNSPLYSLNDGTRATLAGARKVNMQSWLHGRLQEWRLVSIFFSLFEFFIVNQRVYCILLRGFKNTFGTNTISFFDRKRTTWNNDSYNRKTLLVSLRCHNKHAQYCICLKIYADLTLKSHTHYLSCA